MHLLIPNPRTAASRACIAPALILALLPAYAADLPFEAAIVVEKGYRMDVVSQSMQYEYANWTLFKDGSIYGGLPPTAVDDFDTGASRQREPARWGRWQARGNDLEVTWSGPAGSPGPQAVVHKKWFRLETPKPGDTLNAVYAVLNTSAESNAYSSSFATGWKRIAFLPDGRFAQGAGGSVSNERDSSGMVAISKEKDSGTYRIAGPLLELNYADGRTVRASMFFSSADRKVLFLNGVKFRLLGKP